MNPSKITLAIVAASSCERFCLLDRAEMRSDLVIFRLLCLIKDPDSKNSGINVVIDIYINIYMRQIPSSHFSLERRDQQVVYK